MELRHIEVRRAESRGRSPTKGQHPRAPASEPQWNGPGRKSAGSRVGPGEQQLVRGAPPVPELSDKTRMCAAAVWPGGGITDGRTQQVDGHP